MLCLCNYDVVGSDGVVEPGGVVGVLCYVFIICVFVLTCVASL
jgi:hypothetical protein